MNKQFAQTRFAAAAQTNVLVIGDIILDHYVFGSVNRISPEAPVPILNVNKEKFACGGAANVALNLRGMGLNAALMGVIGDDQPGKTVLELLTRAGIATHFIIIDPDRPTTMKSRFIAHHQQIVRVDREETDEVGPHIGVQLLAQLKAQKDAFAGFIYQDYNKGVLSSTFIKESLTILKGRLIAVDPKCEHFFDFQNVTLFKPNLKELRQALGPTINDKTVIEDIGFYALQRLNCEALLVTRSEEGMSLFETPGKVTHIPAKAKTVFDVSGAGDTVIAVATAALACGANFSDAALLANDAAGIVVAELGVVPIRFAELLDILPE